MNSTEKFVATITKMSDGSKKVWEFYHYHKALNYFNMVCDANDLLNRTTGADQRERDAGGIGYDYRIELTVVAESEQKSPLDSVDFYDLMQAYRIAPVSDQDRTSLAYENVKNWIKKNFTQKS